MQLWKRNLIILWFANFTVMAGMSLVMPFLPLYIKSLGLTNTADLTFWVGLVFSGTFMTSAIFAPIWGALSDRTGRKLMLMRSAFGMAVVMGLMGFTTSVEQLFFLRMAGVVSGFIPAAVSLMATNTPKEHVGYALGTLQTGGVSGQIIGPLIGGVLANLFGFRHVFWVTAGVLLVAGCIVTLFVREQFEKPVAAAKNNEGKKKGFALGELRQLQAVWPLLIVAFLTTGSMLMVDPLMSVYITELVPGAENVALIAGMVTASTGIANIIFSPRLGRLGDRIGYKRVLLISMAGAGLMYIPQAFVVAPWQLMICRFGLGMCVGGLMPQVNSLIRLLAPKEMQGRIYGYSTSAMFLGNLTGPNVGGFISGTFGFKFLFFTAACTMMVNAIWLRFAVRVPEKSQGTGE